MGNASGEERVAERRPTGLRDVRALVQDLFPPRPVIYWTDFLLSAGLGWAAFVTAVLVPEFRLPAVLVAVFALYRAVLFIHELTHAARKGVPGFEILWNLLIGAPMLVPSFTYVGVHTDHHRRTLYGTPRDPEYLPLGRPPRSRIVGFLAETVLVPLLFVLRFVILVPFALLLPPLHRFLERKASSLVINVAYERRPLERAERRWMMLWESIACAVWISAALLAWKGVVPWSVFPLWYVVSFGVVLVNQIRTLGAHRYRNEGEEMDVVDQLLDSVNVPGGVLTALWAPVGLRFHALHHYLPDMPYHGLRRTHERLMQALPQDAPYRRVNESGLFSTLKKVWRDAAG